MMDFSQLSKSPALSKSWGLSKSPALSKRCGSGKKKDGLGRLRWVFHIQQFLDTFNTSKENHVLSKMLTSSNILFKQNAYIEYSVSLME